MAVLKSAPISALAIELLKRSIVLPATVMRVTGDEYTGRSGGTVTLDVPVPRVARQQSTPSADIVFDDVNATPVDVTLNHHYDAALVSDETWTLELAEFGRQVLRPQVAAVAAAVEQELASVMNALDASPTIEWASSPDPDDDLATVLSVREALTNAGVPAGDRFLAVSPSIATRLLTIPTFTKAGDRGSVMALEKATIGEVYGLTVVESVELDAGTAIGYHASGFALGNPPPAIPTSALDAAIIKEDGLALRHVLAFVAEKLSSASVISTFAGAAPVLDDGLFVAGKFEPSTETGETLGPAVTLATSAAADDIIDTTTPHGFQAGDIVRFTALTGGAGLTATTEDYYVIAANLAAQTFQVSETAGGAAVDFSTNITAGTVKEVGRPRIVRAIRVASA